MIKSFKTKIIASSVFAALAISPFIVANAGASQSRAHVSLKGLLAGNDLWPTYKARFLDRSGRIVDNANKNVSHSEGQGFSMLMAVAANDRKAFESIWSFTKKNLMVRPDNLAAWRWVPNRLFHVKDKNNATDGDIFIAWALLEAAEAGFGRHYRGQGMAILSDVRKLVKSDPFFGPWLLPAKYGFSASEQGGNHVINLSYWVFPALERLSVMTGDRLWKSLTSSGERLIAHASANAAGLPADWNSLRPNKGKIGLAPKLSTSFSYNAVRVPLYLAWSGSDRRTSLKRFQTNWVYRAEKLKHVDVRINREGKTFRDKGYQAVAAVVNCSLSGTTFPNNLRSGLDQLYYPASLHLLSIIATKQRYPKCW